MILVFDTETTGKADFRSFPTAPHQPKLVQIGAQLLDDSLVVRAELNLIVKPDGWEIPKEASDIHGITTEIATKYGFSLSWVLSQFAVLADHSRLRVAHNLDFDDLVLRSSFALIGEEFEHYEASADSFCTMRAMTSVCQLPGNYGDFKWPKLTEAYKHCTGKDLECAHDAMADVRGCADVYRWLVANGCEVAR